MKKFTKIFVATVMVFTIVSLTLSLAACDDPGNGDDPNNGVYYNNGVDPLVFSTQDVDGVFNPFFSTSATDSNVVGLTQLGMISNDSQGRPVYGDDEATIVKDLEVTTVGTGEDARTTYKFVLKNNVKFSNGSPLTIKDVLFNLYVYLDPAYTGSSTIYSTDIVGLQEYRTQQSNEDEQDAFMQGFRIAAQARIEALVSAFNAIKDEEKDAFSDYTDATFRTRLEQYEDENGEENLVADYDKACELFKEELQNDYSNSKDSYEDVIFTDENNVNYKNLFTTDVEVFLYNEGFYKWNKKDATLECSLWDNLADIKGWTEEYAISLVYRRMMPEAMDEVVQWWATSTNLLDYITNQGMQEYFENLGDSGITNIEGIKFANHKAPVTVNGTTYDVPTWSADGSVATSNEVLSITIEEVDPKAIWNFSFAVAPMYYYSNAEQIALFDYENHFGVVRGSQDFMANVVKDPAKIGVPVGAGPYVASKQSGGTENVSSGDFLNSNIIYFESNPHYLMGEPLVKKVRYQVVSSSQTLNALYGGEIDFAEPNAKPETINELNGKKNEGIGNTSIKTSGYGYIGINAGKVPSIYVRQAIMHSINTELCVEYYKTTASAIHRSMSTASWAYPNGCTAYYPYIGGPVPEDLSVVNPDYAEYVTNKGYQTGDVMTEEDQKDFIAWLVNEKAKYNLDASGVYSKGSDRLKYTFTIAGQETDHPAYKAMFLAGEFLNKVGFEITVTTDANALKKLSTGDLTVWAAAWGSTIDPDMYQVYHKESTATSVLNWGYKKILQNAGGQYDYENMLIDELSELIDAGRKIEDKEARALIYAEALDIVMQLAIELPTYQRDDLFAYNTWKIDESTFTDPAELSPYKGLTSDIHEISLNQEK